MKAAVVAAIMLASLTINLSPRDKTHDCPKEVTQGCSDHHDTIIINPAKDVDPSYKKQLAENKSPHWYSSPAWILIIVGCIIDLLIGWQSFETRMAATASTRAVKATERSNGHMEVANRIR